MLCERAAELGDAARAVPIARTLGAFEPSGDAAAATALAVVFRFIRSGDRSAESLLLSQLAGLKDPHSLRNVLSAVAHDGGALPPDLLERCWFLMLHQLSSLPRTALLETLFSLGPLMETLVGRRGVAAIAADVRQVVAWWP